MPSKYIQKHALYPPLISTAPTANVGIIVVIPCHDEPDVVSSLQALATCAMPKCNVEIIVLINDSANGSQAIKQQNKATLAQAQKWSAQHFSDKFRCYPIYIADMPPKHAGVGLARKIGMDEAARRLEKINNPEGIIACFDADSSCDTNYLQALEKHFTDHLKTQACGIHFEHPTSGNAHPPAVYDAIVQYELYLRYYVNALRFAGFEQAHQTIGSSMAVRADAYQQQGGMNRRKAGEDFYFLQKFIALNRCSELHTTRVIPSPRPSHRVPFGTGKAVGDLLQADGTYLAYHPNIFNDLKQFLKKINDLYALHDPKHIEHFLEKLPPTIQTFLRQNDVQNKLLEIQKNTSSPSTFKQRFYRWFNAFLVLKYVHHARDMQHASIPTHEAATQLLEALNLPPKSNATSRDLLMIFRNLDRK